MCKVLTHVHINKSPKGSCADAQRKNNWLIFIEGWDKEKSKAIWFQKDMYIKNQGAIKTHHPVGRIHFQKFFWNSDIGSFLYYGHEANISILDALSNTPWVISHLKKVYKWCDCSVHFFIEQLACVSYLCTK